MRKTKTAKQPLSTQRQVVDDIPASPVPIELAPNQIAEMKDRHQQFMARVAELSNVLSQDAAAVVRATRDGSFLDTDEDYKDLAKRARRDYGRGTFLIDRLGAAGLLDPTLAAVLLDLRSRLLATYGASAAAGMLIDQAVVAYQNFLRVTGWTGNTALMVEAEFFGQDRPSAQFRDRYGDDGRSIRGLTVEQHIARLGEELMPLAERFGRIMRDTVAALEGLRTVADQSVERSTPIVIPIASLLDREGHT
jgi:hypothetical protein